jgi:hypothetical protein
MKKMIRREEVEKSRSRKSRTGRVGKRQTKTGPEKKSKTDFTLESEMC